MDDSETRFQPAGWYDDPDVPGGKRYWSGSEWTDQRREPTRLRASYERIAPSPGAKIAFWIASVLSVVLVASVIVGAIAGHKKSSPDPTSSATLTGANGSSGADVLTQRQPGAPRPGSTALPRFPIRGQQGPVPYRHLVQGVFDHLDVVWSLEMRGLHARFRPPSKYIPFSAGAGPRCPGTPGRVGHQNAEYCAANNTIAWGQTGLLIPFYRRVGVDAVAFVLAHEYGHLIQNDLGILEKFPVHIEAELNADCLAGAFLASVRGTGIHFDQSDVNTIKKAIFIVGDQPGTPWQDPRAHGSPAERQHALNVGINTGTEGCLKQLAPGFTR